MTDRPARTVQPATKDELKQLMAESLERIDAYGGYSSLYALYSVMLLYEKAKCSR